MKRVNCAYSTPSLGWCGSLLWIWRPRYGTNDRLAAMCLSYLGDAEDWIALRSKVGHMILGVLDWEARLLHCFLRRGPDHLEIFCHVLGLEQDITCRPCSQSP